MSLKNNVAGERGVLTSILCEPSHFEASQAPFSRTGCLPDSPGALQHHTFLAQLPTWGTRNSRGGAGKDVFSAGSICSSEAAHAQLGSRRLHPKGSTAALSSTSLAPRTRCLNWPERGQTRRSLADMGQALEVVAELLLQDYEEQTSVYSKQGTME